MPLKIVEVHFDCAGSRNLGGGGEWVSRLRSRCVAVRIFAHGGHFAWQVQGKPRGCTSKCRFRGRSSTLDMVVIFEADLVTGAMSRYFWTCGSFADFVAGAALCEPRRADFVAVTARCDPRHVDFVAGAALCEPRCAEFVTGTALCEPRSAESVTDTALCEPRRADFLAVTALGEPRSADFVAGTALGEPRSADFVAGTALCVRVRHSTC